MSDIEVRHYGITALKQLSSSLNRVPRADEFIQRLPRYDYVGIFGSYEGFLMAAGLHVLQNKNTEKFKYKKTLFDSFNISEINLDQLFEECGNPDVIKLIAQPDTHVENRDKIAVNVFLKFIEWYNPHAHIIMGDFIDAEGISHWPPDELKPREFIPEVIEARELIESIISKTPNAKLRVYLGGNHEDWIRQAMIAKLPTLFNGLKDLGLMPDLEALLDLKKYGYDLIEMNHLFKIGKANFTHGLYTGNGHAKKHLDVIKGNIYYGHLHDVMSYHQPTMNGMIEAASLGCLCRLDAKFTKGKPTNWVHGFGVFEFFRDGTYSFNQIKILNGKFSFNGKIFS